MIIYLVISLINCTDYLRSLLLIKSGITKESLLGQAVDRYSASVLSAWNNIQIERALDIFMQLYRDIRYSLSPRYEFELAVSRLCWLKDYVSPSEVKKAIEGVRPLLEGASGARSIVMDAPAQPAAQPVQDKDKALKKEQVSSPQKEAPQHNTYVPMFSALAEAQMQEETEETETNPFEESGAEPHTENSAINTSISEEPSPAEPTPPVVTQVDINSVESIKNAMIQEFNAEDAMLAGLLSSTYNWQINGNELSVVIPNMFEKMRLEQNAQKIENYLSATFAKKMSFSVKLEEEKADIQAEELPTAVQILCDMFKGSVLGAEK